MSVSVRAKVIWLRTVTALFVTFMETSGTTFPCRALEFAAHILVGKAERLVVSIVSDAAIRKLSFTRSLSCCRGSFSSAFVALVSFLNLCRSWGARLWSFMVACRRQ